MMSTVTKVVRRSALGLGIVAGLVPTLLVMINQLLAPLTARRTRTRFEFYEAKDGGSQRVFVIFHGLWSSAWGLDQVASFVHQGSVLAVLNGANVDAVARDALQELRRLGL